MTKGKTKDFKERQCRYCERSDKIKFRQRRPCCPLPNPRIRNGHCLERKATKKPIARLEKGG
ncbi:hypothetical protein LCGC14_0732970 [marine sediment metagenome]|uniref:Uncharacterized protein n=1 Tax=marine sediment metagenome TaxID=412755 RepID=A0A0F9TGC0_9ZZZZ